MSRHLRRTSHNRQADPPRAAWGAMLALATVFVSSPTFADEPGAGRRLAEFRQVAAELERMQLHADPDLDDVRQLAETALVQIEQLGEDHGGDQQFAAQLRFLCGEIHRRYAQLLPEDDPLRDRHLEQAVTAFQDLRVVHRDLRVGELGYIGEARAHRVAGELSGAREALRPLLSSSQPRTAAGRSLRALAELERLEIELQQSPQEVVEGAQRLQRQQSFRENPRLAEEARWLEARATMVAGNGADPADVLALLRETDAPAAAREFERLSLMRDLEEQVDQKLMTRPERLAWATAAAGLGYGERAAETFAAVAQADASALNAQHWTTYGSVLWQQQRPAEAADAFERALDHETADPSRRHELLEWRAVAMQRVLEQAEDDSLAPQLAGAWLALAESDADHAVRAHALQRWLNMRRDHESPSQSLTELRKHEAIVEASPALAYEVQALRWRAWHEQHDAQQRQSAQAANALHDILDRLQQIQHSGDAATSARAALLAAIIQLNSPVRDAEAAEERLREHWEALSVDDTLAPSATRWRATAMLQLGRIDAADQLLEHAPESTAPAETLVALAQALADRYPAATGNDRGLLRKRVRQLVDRAMERSSGQAAHVHEVTRLLLEVDAHAEAVRLISYHLEVRAAVMPADQRARLHAMLGRSQRQIGDLDAAIQTLRSAVEEYPDHASLHQELGRSLLALDDYAESVSWLRRARAAYPRGSGHWWEVTLDLATVRAEMGEPAGARDMLRAAGALYPPPNRPTLQQRIRDVRRQLDEYHTSHAGAADDS